MKRSVPLLSLCLLCLCLLGQNPVRAAGSGNTERPRLYLPVAGVFTSPFGSRPNRGGRVVRMHKGIDIMAETGTPVCAAAPGTISFVGVRSGYGLMVEIDHGQGLRTRYAHLDTCLRAAGSPVETADLLGTVGKSGRATGPNLHFETVIRGRFVDPLPLLGVDWQPHRLRRAAQAMRPRPGVFARFTPQPPPAQTLLAPTSIPNPARPAASSGNGGKQGARAIE